VSHVYLFCHFTIFFEFRELAIREVGRILCHFTGRSFYGGTNLLKIRDGARIKCWQAVAAEMTVLRRVSNRKTLTKEQSGAFLALEILDEELKRTKFLLLCPGTFVPFEPVESSYQASRADQLSTNIIAKTFSFDQSRNR